MISLWRKCLATVGRLRRRMLRKREPPAPDTVPGDSTQAPAHSGTAFRPTGLWPFSLLPQSVARMGRMSRDSEARVAQIFDPVALAWEAGSKLIDAGWVGLENMDADFLWQVVDAQPTEVAAIVESWAGEHQGQIADLFSTKLHTYRADQLAVQAMEQAIDSYRRGHFLATVRTLMPEVERAGRLTLERDGRTPKNHREATKAIQEYVDNLEVLHFEPIESLTVCKVLADDLFARCFTAENARGLERGLSRHAELHGLGSYGHVRGATNMLAVADFLLHGLSVRVPNGYT